MTTTTTSTHTPSNTPFKDHHQPSAPSAALLSSSAVTQNTVITNATTTAQVLDIIPKNELKFIGPFDTQVISKILLTNLTDNVIQYKLKTTVPKRYCVRPNSGFIGPKAWVEVLVALQHSPLSGTEKNKHKFMVQSVVEPFDGTMTAYSEQDWKNVNPEKVMNHKLKCVFEEAPSANQGNEQEVLGEVPLANKANEKNKKVTDTKAASKAPLPGVSGEVQKLCGEVIQLRDEECKLRHENLCLKEEMQQLRTMLGSGAGTHSYSPPSTQLSTFNELTPAQIIAGAILIAVIGCIIGKYAM